MGKIIESKRGILFSARSGSPQSGNSSDITADKFGKLWVASSEWVEEVTEYLFLEM